MAKQMVEVEVPDGWEVVEYRRPRMGDHYLRAGLGIQMAPCDFEYERIIVRKAWQWPAWLKAAWIAMDLDGEWYAWSKLPRIACNTDHWYDGGDLQALNPELVDFTPPPCDDWRQSLRKNPNL